jgi:thiol:disulfide interchange protein
MWLTAYPYPDHGMVRLGGFVFTGVGAALWLLLTSNNQHASRLLTTVATIFLLTSLAAFAYFGRRGLNHFHENGWRTGGLVLFMLASIMFT